MNKITINTLQMIGNQNIFLFFANDKSKAHPVYV